jgi:hypothetical protein
MELLFDLDVDIHCELHQPHRDQESLVALLPTHDRLHIFDLVDHLLHFRGYKRHVPRGNCYK